MMIPKEKTKLQKLSWNYDFISIKNMILKIVQQKLN